MAGGAKRKGLISDINVTPLVDIMLVLLIVFMLTASLIHKQAIEVELPAASSGAVPEPTTLAITLDQQGKLYLDGEPTSGADLRAAVQEAVREDDKAQAIIAADKRVSHGRVVWVIDAVKQAGVASFAINIDPTALVPPEEPEEPGGDGGGGGAPG